MTRATSSSDYARQVNNFIGQEHTCAVTPEMIRAMFFGPLIFDQLIRHTLPSTVSIFSYFFISKGCHQMRPIHFFHIKMNELQLKKKYTEQSMHLT